MSWSKIVASYLVIAQMILAPMTSYAGAPELEVQDNRLTEAGQKNAAALSEYAAKMNYDSRLDLKNNKMYFVDRDSKKVVGEVVLRDQKSLMEYSPKTLNQRLNAGMANLKIASRESALHTWKAFPVESAAFFLALGGMTAIQLMTNYADNPIGMKQHIEHSLSPVGQLGFFMFMYSQGITANTLNMWLQKPKLAMPIGMLGMTVGMTVQSYFTQVVSDPHIRKCAASVFKGEKIENGNHPCEGAYKYLVLDKKILEGPGIASMLGSFLVVTGARMAVGAVLRLVGIELTTLLIPGGVAVKGARWMVTLAISGANAAAFTVVQMKLEHYISYAWKNYFDGKEFVTINDDIVSEIEAQKKSQWTGKGADFNKDLREFAKKMSEWRVHNLSEAYMANQAWAGFLGELTSMYNASYNFYGTYVQELTGKESLIDKTYPLFGVTPKDLSDGHNDNYFTRPERIEKMQMDTVKDVANFVGQNLQSGYYQKIGFIKFQLDIMNKIYAGLNAADPETQGKAILELNDARRRYAQNIVGSPEFNRELYKIASMLGEPNPMFEKGRGYAATMMMSPSVKEAFKDLSLDSYNGRFKTPTIADYFLVQMMCGADTTKGEKVIQISKGYPAKFIPPTIALYNETKEDLCFGATQHALGSERLYNLPFGRQKTVPEFLRANINPEVAVDFQAWWDKNTEAPLKEAFKGFGQSYKTIIEKLYKGLNETKNSNWNRGFISNGALIASFQEARLYSLILGEMLKDSYKVQNSSELPAEYFNTNPEPKIMLAAADYNMSKKPLLALLARGPRYDFNTLLSAQPNGNARSLKVQAELEHNLALMNGLIQRAKSKTVKAEEYQNQLKAIESSLSEFSTLLGVNKENPGPGLVTLGADQKTLAVTCLELLQAVSQEMAMYGNMAGTARYPDAK